MIKIRQKEKRDDEQVVTPGDHIHNKPLVRLIRKTEKNLS